MLVSRAQSDKCMSNYLVPENIHTHPMDGKWKFQECGGSQKPQFLKESMKQNRNFLRGWVWGGGGSNQQTIRGGNINIFFPPPHG